MTESARSSLIRLASSHPPGSEERVALLRLAAVDFDFRRRLSFTVKVALRGWNWVTLGEELGDLRVRILAALAGIVSELRAAGIDAVGGSVPRVEEMGFDAYRNLVSSIPCWVDVPSASGGGIDAVVAAGIDPAKLAAREFKKAGIRV